MLGWFDVWINREQLKLATRANGQIASARGMNDECMVTNECRERVSVSEF